MTFRLLTPLEKKILTKILQIDDPRNRRLVSQIDGLMAEADGPLGSIFLSAYDQDGRISTRRLAHALRSSGHLRDSHNMLIEFIVFIDEQDRLSSLEVVKYDGKELIEEIDPEMIVVSSEAC